MDALIGLSNFQPSLRRAFDVIHGLHTAHAIDLAMW